MDNLNKNKDYINNIVNEWKDILDEGASFKSEKVRRATAIMLNNEAVHLNGGQPISETTAVGSNSLGNTGQYGQNYGTPGSIGSGEFHKIAIPMVRRTFPELIAHDIVGVQPLTGPVGLAFALRFKAASGYDTSADTDYYNTTNQDSYGNTITNEVGYNRVKRGYSGAGTTAMVTSAGEALGSDASTANRGLGIGTNAEIAELSMTVEKAQVEAKTRKLRSRWSMEVAQDLKAMHGLNLEEEMMDVLAYEITAEIDRELIAKIRGLTTAAGTSAQCYTALDWNSQSATGDFNGRWEAEVYRNLYNYVIRKSNKIAVTTRRGPGNYVVASPNMVAVLEATAAFTIAPVNTDVNSGITGVSRVGSLDGRMNVYRDTFAANDSLLIGYKGPSEYDTGVVYLPYIQLMASKATFEDSFQPTVGLMSRYAIHDHMFGSHNFYQQIVVSNFTA